MKRVAIVGIQGVPARYGGFESLVENIIGDNQSSDVKYTIFCSSKDMEMTANLTKYKGCDLRYIPMHANGSQSIAYDIWSMAKTLRGHFDTVLVLGVSGCMALPLFRRMTSCKWVVNIDGLEHRREKWGKVARWILRTSESMAVKHAHTVIADNEGIRQYVQETYGRDAVLIAYGGDHVMRTVVPDEQRKILEFYGLKPHEYAITVCRIEPENNCHVTLEAFARAGKKLVFVGNWTHSDYAIRLKDRYQTYQNITILDAIYNLDTLFTLRSNAGWYIHGHSAGGTNPSLVEAMFFGRPIMAFDVNYNRATTAGLASYFTTADDLCALLQTDSRECPELSDYAREHYIWSRIAHQYEALY